jgi:ABC-2 type transport system permease protein
VTVAVIRALWLALLRDRGALLMVFAAPVAFFVIFAEVFATAASGELTVNLAVTDEVRSADSRRLLEALQREPLIRRVTRVRDREGLRERVRRGEADVGLVVRSDGEPLGSADGSGPPPLLLVVEPSRTIAATVLAGQLQRTYLEALPDLALRTAVALIEGEFTSLNETQRREIERGLAEVAAAPAAGQAVGRGFGGLFDEEPVAGQSAALNHVAYYAGALAFLFVLLSASHGALTLLEERDTGLLDRVVAGPGGLPVVVNGKFLFLTAQGIVQTLVIFAVAWLGYGVRLASVVPAWLAIVTLASATAAAIGLALVSACRSRAQAQTFSTVVILLISAIGGSMVPRFFMPELLQDLGWLTPNAWALEAYTGILWRSEPLSAQALPCVVLLLVTLAALLLAHWRARGLTRV